MQQAIWACSMGGTAEGGNGLNGEADGGEGMSRVHWGWGGGFGEGRRGYE